MTADANGRAVLAARSLNHARDPRRGSDRSESHRKPHQPVAEAGLVVLEVDLGRGHDGPHCGEPREAAFEVAGPDVADEVVDPMDSTRPRSCGG